MSIINDVETELTKDTIATFLKNKGFKTTDDAYPATTSKFYPCYMGKYVSGGSTPQQFHGVCLSQNENNLFFIAGVDGNSYGGVNVPLQSFTLYWTFKDNVIAL